jgi:2',3'-cyclic-nucleotide 2'-phosphodiesterase/3'-nucleotidase
LCKNTKGLDAVISAHSHRIVHGFVNHIPVVQGYCYGRAIAYLRIFINHYGRIKIIPKVDLVYKRKKYIVPDKQAQHALNHYMRLLPKSYQQVLARSTGNFYHSIGNLKSHPLDVWLCSLLQKDFHTQIGIMNGGLVRGDLLKGSITMLSLKRVICFNDKIITLRLSGKDIYKLLEKDIPYGIQFSGLKVYYKYHAKYHHVVKILLNNKPINRQKYYSIVINDFMFAGGDHENFVHAIDVVHTHKLINNKIINLIKQLKIIHPMSENNLIVI